MGDMDDRGDMGDRGDKGMVTWITGVTWRTELQTHLFKECLPYETVIICNHL